jgi:hypothetical protein
MAGIGRRWVLFALVIAIVTGCGQPADLSSPTPSPTTAPATPTVTLPSSATPDRDPDISTPTNAPTPRTLPTTSPTARTSPTATGDADVETVNTPTLRPPGGTPTTQANVVSTAGTPAVVVTATPLPATATSEPTPTTPPAPEPTPTAVPPTATPTVAPPTATPEICPGAIPWHDAANYKGSYATVIGPVVSAVYASDVSGAPTFLNIGTDYPDASRFTVLIWVEYRANFPAPPEEMYAGATVCVAGTITDYDDIAEILVTGPDQIWIP